MMWRVQLRERIVQSASQFCISIADVFHLYQMDASDKAGKVDNVPLTHGEARWAPTLFLYALLANNNNSEVGPRF